MKRKVLAAILIFAFIFTLVSVPAFAEGDAVTVYLDGAELSFDVPPRIVDGRVLVPMRALFEALGAEVWWDGDTKTAFAYNAEKEKGLAVTVGSDYLLDDGGNSIPLDVPAMLENGRTLLPLRAIAEASPFNCYVEWDNEFRTVDILSEEMQSYADAAEKQEQIHVSNTEELLNAIGSDRAIVLSSDYYNLSDDVKVDNPFVEKHDYDDGYTIKNVSNMSVNGQYRGVYPKIVTDDITADVLLFESCENITLFCLSIGHTESLSKYACEGAVTRFNNCKNIYIPYSELFGCGAFGVYADNTDNLYVLYSKIYDCSYTGIWLTGGSTAKVSRCEFCDSSHMSGFIRIDNSKIRLANCDVHDIVCEGAFVDTFDFGGAPSEVTLKNCGFTNISYTGFINSNEVRLTADGCEFN